LIAMQSRPFWQNHPADSFQPPRVLVVKEKMKKINPKANGKNIQTSLREATESDIPRLGVHHRKMFEEIWEKKGESIDPSVGKAIERAYAKKLKQELTDGSCKAWVIESENKIVASGTITIASLVPTPRDLSSSVAYLHSMYTEKEYRNNHFANLIVERAIQFCRNNGINRIFLNASEAGRPIYEKLGFRTAPEMMRLVIE
jgi:GNAT superfamily N-acetyltransferase